MKACLPVSQDKTERDGAVGGGGAMGREGLGRTEQRHREGPGEGCWDDDKGHIQS